MNDLDKLLVTLKSIFSDFLGAEYVDVDISYKDLSTKDGKILSPKQWICLFKYFDSDLGITKDFIKNSTYDEISHKIKIALQNRKYFCDYTNEDFGDRQWH